MNEIQAFSPKTVILAALLSVFMAACSGADGDPGGNGGDGGSGGTAAAGGDGGSGGVGGDGGSGGVATIVSDDFDAETLNAAEWQIVDPVGDSTVEFVGAGTADAHMLLSIPGGTAHNAWNNNTSLRVMQRAPNEDFELEVKFESEPTEQYQSQGLIVEQEPGTYIRFDVSSDGFNRFVFASVFDDGSDANHANDDVTPGPISYLRLARAGSDWTGWYSTDGENWTMMMQFSLVLDVQSVGVFAANFDPSPAFTVAVDYFFETSSPIEPEDTPLCLPGEQFTLTANVVGPGSIVQAPSKATYDCGETVMLTAQENAGAFFSAWSGAVSGTEPIQSVTMYADTSVTATFDPDTIPPVVSEVNLARFDTSAVLHWQTDELSTGIVEYGETSAYELGSIASSGTDTLHSVTLPSLTAATTYHWRIVAEDEFDNSVASDDATFDTTNTGPGGPTIDVWYGSYQEFGTAGVPQRFINILGKVVDPDGVPEFTYSLNGGPEYPLSIGRDGFRLQNDNDYNVEIAYADLEPGLNTVAIHAIDGLDYFTVETVDVEYVDDFTTPIPYSIDWSSSGDISNVAQIVDGKWSQSSEGMRVAEIGYDRLIAIGDIGWTDYEALVEFTVNVLPDPAIAPVIGLAMRWTGHWDWDGSQPRIGWYPLGALIAFDWHQGQYTGLVTWESDGAQVFGPGVTPIPVAGEPQLFKMRCETLPNGDVLYNAKMWPANQLEPGDWTVTYSSDASPVTGSLLVVAHEIDVTLGNISIVPVGN